MAQGYVSTRTMADGRLAVCHAVTRREVAEYLGVKVADVPEVPARGGPFARQSTRWIVYTVTVGPKRTWQDRRDATLFTVHSEALEMWRKLHPYNDPAGNGYCFDCGLAHDHPEAQHSSAASAPCSGGCGKVRSILHSDDPAQWLCYECSQRNRQTPGA